MATSPSRILSDLRARPATRFFVTITRAVPGFAVAWWALLLVRALVPAGLAITTGVLVGRVEGGGSLTGPLAAFGIFFVLSQVGPPVHQVVGAMLGHHVSSVLNDRLMATTLGPDGVGHLERGDLTNDLTTARDFDLGWTGPPMFMNMDFIAQGLAMLLGGIASALVLFGFTWWAPLLLLAAWGSTDWLLRESGVWRDRNTDEVKSARRHTDYAYDLATEPTAAKEVRLFGLAPWLLERFTRNRLHLHQLQYDATRLREKSLTGALLIVLSANALVFVVLGPTWVRRQPRPPVGRHLLRRGVRRQRDRLRRAQLGARRRSGPRRLDRAPRGRDGGGRRALPIRRHQRAAEPSAGDPVPRRDVHLSHRQPAGPRPLRPHDPGRRVAGDRRPERRRQDHHRQAALPPLRPRLRLHRDRRRRPARPRPRRLAVAAWPPSSRTSSATGSPSATTSRRSAPRPTSSSGPRQAGALDLADLDAPMAKGYAGASTCPVASGSALPGPSDREGRHRCATPCCSTSQRPCSTSAASRRSSASAGGDVRATDTWSPASRTVRQAELICVVEHGRALELGSHDDLIALRGRYHTMYDLQASRFHDEKELDEHGEEVVHESL